MRNQYYATENVEALYHTQKAFDILDGLVTKTPQINEMMGYLEEV